MGAVAKRPLAITVVLALLLALTAVLYVGCGGGGKKDSGGGYNQAVLDRWSKIEATSGSLVKEANKIEEESGLEDLLSELDDARGEIGDFEEELDGLKVPAELEESNGFLEDFLSAYDDYLASIADLLDEVLGGNLDVEIPDFESLADDARGAQEDYQDSQDFNPAELDEGIWGLSDAMLDAMVVIYGGNDPDNPIWEEAVMTIDTYYTSFNLGDGEAMYRLIDPDSPILADVSEDFFLTQVGEAYGAGLEAEYSVDDIEGYTDEAGKWATAYLTVDYTETVDMEGNPIPAHSEEVIFDLHYSQDIWWIYDITSQSGLW